MAPKKSKNAVMDRGTPKVLPGTPVRFVGIAGATFTCPTCSSTMRNAILWRMDGVEYCSRHCFPAKAE